MLSAALAAAPYTDASVPGPLADAVRAGLRAATVGEAFLGGYRAALHQLVPSLAGHAAALAATEEGPLHPRTVTTAVAGDRVTGRKRWITGAPGADRAVVLARAGADGDRVALVAVIVALDGPGATLQAMPPTPFVPDVPHAELTLQDAPVLARVPGDGWADVVRPFRTVEDLHVHAAAAAYLLAVGERSGWGPEPMAALCAGLAALATLARRDPADPAAHLALAGVLAGLHATAASLPWSDADPDEAARWQRDAALLSVAQRARDARLAAAVGRLSP
ncbi:MAG: acyl-CoA dehydrogenase family protein [Myxococcota bacterium]